MKVRDVRTIAADVYGKLQSMKQEYAYVQAIDGVRVDIRMAASNTILKNARLLGDTNSLSVGDTVAVAYWENGRPVVTAVPDLLGLDGRIDAIESELDAIRIYRDLGDPSMGGGLTDLQRIILLKTADNTTVIYEPTSTGLAEVEAEAQDDDIIIIPAKFIQGEFAPPACEITGFGTSESILGGPVMLAGGTTLENLTVERIGVDEELLVAVYGPSEGQAIVQDCNIVARGCTVSVGIMVDEEADEDSVLVMNSRILGIGAGGGYAISVGEPA